MRKKDAAVYSTKLESSRVGLFIGTSGIALAATAYIHWPTENWHAVFNFTWIWWGYEASLAGWRYFMLRKRTREEEEASAWRRQITS